MSDVQGNRAHDATDRGAPVKIGGKAASSAPTAVAAADRVDAYFDENGRIVVRTQFPTEWLESAAVAGASGGLSVSHAASTGNVHKITDLAASGDAAALVTLESPSGTTLWRKRFTAAFNFSEQFSVPVTGASAGAVVARISADTANAEVNFQGYTTTG